MKLIQIPIISNPNEYCWGDLLIYTWIKYKANTKDYSVYIKVSTLMDFTQLSADKINAALRRFQEKGLIQIYSENNFIKYYIYPIHSKNYINAEILVNATIKSNEKEFLLRLNPYIKQVNEHNAYCWLTEDEILKVTGLSKKLYKRYTHWLEMYNFIKWHNEKWWFNLKHLEDKYPN